MAPASVPITLHLSPRQGAQDPNSTSFSNQNTTSSQSPRDGSSDSNHHGGPSRSLEVLPGIALIVVFLVLLMYVSGRLRFTTPAECLSPSRKLAVLTSARLGYRAWFSRQREQESEPPEIPDRMGKESKLARITDAAKVQTYEEWKAEMEAAAQSDGALHSFITQDVVWYAGALHQQSRASRYTNGVSWLSSPVCLELLEEKSHVRCLPCKHIFHRKCLEKWYLKDQYTCPMCKAAFCTAPKPAKLKPERDMAPGPIF